MNTRKVTSINQDFQRETNLSVVLRAIWTDCDCTRVKLKALTGLAATSVTKIVTQLIEWGIVEERDSIGEGVGRKAVKLHLNVHKYHVAAVRINRQYMIAAIFDMAGNMINSIQHKNSPAEGVHASIIHLKDMLKELFTNSHTPIMGIGVAVPGPFNYTTGRITLMSGFPGWSEIDLRSILTDEFRMPVFIEHDANCGALAEMYYDHDCNNTDMVFITADRGIGAGLILNSTVYHGHDGFAGEIGHASINVFGPRCECGNRGCLEMYASSNALENAYKSDAFDPSAMNIPKDGITSDEIWRLVRSRDPNAMRAYRKTIGYLCFGIVGLINTLNPKTIVFADRMINGGTALIETAHEVFRKHLLPEIYEKLNIKICSIPGDPMLLGASVFAFDQMLLTPSDFFSTTVI